jgi:3',5'-cyclic AMP phosphodiesterase CpdA
MAALTAALAVLAGGTQNRPTRLPARVPEQVAHRPTAIPDRIILTWTGDPATTQAVTWRTDSTVARAVAQIAEAEPGPKFVERAITHDAVTTPLATDLGDARYHTVRFEELLPGTRYAYRVGDGVNWSEWLQFRTAREEPEPFSFIYFGDAQNELKSLWSRVIREAYSDAPKASFIIHAGDLVNRANRDGEWGEWHAAGGWVNGMVPNLPTPGNHEYETPTGGQRALSRHWRPQFALPENGPLGLEETCYFVDYQGVRVVSLNSNEKQREQAAWLDQVLSRNPQRWTVVTFHHPLYSTARGRDNAALRNIWKPVLDKHRVDIVLQGHDHSYARGNLRSGTNARSGAGTMYVVSVSGPKQYALDRQPWMQRAAEETQLYQIITIDGARLRYEARTAIGTVYDAFELRKQNGRPTRLIERTPRGVPERTRTP